MDINISGIKNQLQASYQFVVEQTGKLAHHTVRVIQPAVDVIKQNKLLAVATVAVSNILLVEIAVRTTYLVDKIFELLFGPEDNWTETGTFVNSCFLLAFVTSAIIGMNVALYKTLQSPLSPLVMGAVSTASCASYVFFRVWKEG